MVKTVKNFSGTKRPMTLKRCMHDRVLEFYQVCSNNDPCLTLKNLMARSNLVPCDFVWEKDKTIDFSETIVVKVGRRSNLHEYVNLYEYERSRSFIDHWSKFTQIQHFQTLFLRNRWAAIHICGKNFKNLLVWNQKADYLETLYAESANRLLPKE